MGGLPQVRDETGEGAKQFSDVQEFGALLAARYGLYDIELAGDSSNWSGTLDALALNSFSATHVLIRGITLRRFPEHLPEYWKDRVFVNLQLDGSSVMRQHGRQVVLKPGDVVIMDPLAYSEVCVSEFSHTITLHLDRFAWMDRFSGRGVGFVRKIPASSNVGLLASRMIRSIEESGQDLDVREQKWVGESMLDMIAAGLGEIIGVAPLAPDSEKLERLRSWAITVLEDPEFAPDRMASRLGMSVRALYRLFSRCGTTPSAWLWNLRLDQARSILSNSLRAYDSITQVAFSVGFSDAAHFSRAFRRRFGTSPRLYRRDT